LVVALTPAETGVIVRRIEPELATFADDYDKGKYPPAKLAELRRVFAGPEKVTGSDIEAALVWKYGHTGKTNYPRRQRELAIRIGKLWRANPIVPGAPPAATFDTWRSRLGPTSFITVCFLLHLANPKDLPILDQHTFRSVNRHLTDVRPGIVVRARPSRFEDLILVRDFSVAVMRDWNRHSESARPSADRLDHYLMMHGKSLKVRRGPSTDRSGLVITE
jgi:hypothetical protein